jgi:transposase-like protein
MSATRNKFSPEFRDRAVRRVGEHRADYPPRRRVARGHQACPRCQFRPLRHAQGLASAAPRWRCRRQMHRGAADAQHGPRVCFSRVETPASRQEARWAGVARSAGLSAPGQASRRSQRASCHDPAGAGRLGRRATLIVAHDALHRSLLSPCPAPQSAPSEWVRLVGKCSRTRGQWCDRRHRATKRAPRTTPVGSSLRSRREPRSGQRRSCVPHALPILR